MNVANQMAVRRDVQNVVDLFNKVHDKKYNGYAYGAGYLGSLVSEVISKLPKREREVYIKQLMQAIEENVWWLFWVRSSRLFCGKFHKKNLQKAEMAPVGLHFFWVLQMEPMLLI